MATLASAGDIQVGKIYLTRDGRPAKVTDAHYFKEFPFSGVVKGFWLNPIKATWNSKGKFLTSGEHHADLVQEPAPIKLVSIKNN
jgi:hypothetical protein